MEANVSDYDSFATSVSADDLKTLAELARSLSDAEAQEEKAELALKNAKEQARMLRECTIPELMAKCGVKDFSTTDGLRIQVKHIVRASIPKANSVQAVAWLDEHGHSGLVKRKVLLEFTRAEEERARELAARLRKEFSNVAEEATVHPMTLSAWVRGQIDAGTPPPAALFGVSEYDEAKISVAVRQPDRAPGSQNAAAF